jgi:hypothetical protein
MLRLSLLAGLGLLILCAPASAAKDKDATDISAQRRTRITVYPSYQPGPYATRQCESWLQRENRPSGPVLTPQMRCWWR